MSEPTFEEAQRELEAIVERLERGDAGIDELTKLWERGEELYRICAAKLDSAEERVARLAEALQTVRPDDQERANPQDPFRK